jgi:monoamine oxidase
VIVVGAGVAGLSSAGRLAAAGAKVVVLEARDRIGGRIHSIRDPSIDMPLELGAEFVHGKHPVLLSAAKGINLEKIDGEDCCSTPSGLRRCDFFDQIDDLLAKMEGHSSEDMSFASFLRSLPPSAADEQTRRRALGYVEGFNAANAEEISVQSLVADRRAQEEIGGDESYRFTGGYDALVKQMRARCEAAGVAFCLNYVVQKVEWNSGIEISGQNNSGDFHFSAEAGVITVPIPVLQQRAISFEPALPSDFQEALAAVANGHVVRVALIFKERFWSKLRTQEGKSLEKLRFLFAVDRDDISHFPTFWTARPQTAPMIVAWSPAHRALSLQGLPKDVVVTHALDDLAKALRFDRAELDQQLTASHTHLWDEDPFSRGAYGYFRVGGADAPQVLSRPLADKLFFAGETIAPSGNSGTVHGAIASGEQAAERLLPLLAL